MGPKGESAGFCPARPLVNADFLGALLRDSLTAPCVFDGLIDGECFRAYVE